MPTLRSEIRELPVALSDGDLLERHQSLLAIIDDIEHEEGDLSTIKQQYKSKFEELENERTRLLQVVRERKEPRDVVVNLVFDVAADHVSEVRDDTGEVLLVREPTSDERQIPMFTDDADDAPAPSKRRGGRKRATSAEEPTESASTETDAFADTPASNESQPPAPSEPSSDADETPW